MPLYSRQRAMKWHIYGLVLLTGLLLACQPSVHGVDTKANSPTWSVSLTISGGFTGQIQSISIDEQGMALFTDRKKQLKTRQKLGTTQLQQLEKLVKYLSDQPTAATPPSKSCRDCQRYALHFRYADKTGRRTLTDLNVTKSDATELIQALRTLTKQRMP